MWEYYHEAFESLEAKGFLRRPIVPSYCQHNAHMYHVLLRSDIDRQVVLSELKRNGISAVFHYVPLHSSPAGLRYGRGSGSMRVTNRSSTCLIRLPLWVGLTRAQ
nr:DegT/DnrJ/EryC1/StrS family aminotransferase [Pseudomonas sp. OTU750018]